MPEPPLDSVPSSVSSMSGSTSSVDRDWLPSLLVRSTEDSDEITNMQPGSVSSSDVSSPPLSPMNPNTIGASSFGSKTDVSSRLESGNPCSPMTSPCGTTQFDTGMSGGPDTSLPSSAYSPAHRAQRSSNPRPSSASTTDLRIQVQTGSSYTQDYSSHSPIGAPSILSPSPPCSASTGDLSPTHGSTFSSIAAITGSVSRWASSQLSSVFSTSSSRSSASDASSALPSQTGTGDNSVFNLGQPQSYQSFVHGYEK